jgi:hypothetical protein
MEFKTNYWPLDFDPEDEIYDNPSWDMPGHRRRPKVRQPRKIRQPKSLSGIKSI